MMLPIQAQAHPVNTWRVTRVIDADTLVANGVTIRLALTDAYAISTDRGKLAANYVTSICLNYNAIVHVDSKQPTDIFGRTVAKVTCMSGGIYHVLNAEILWYKYGVIDTRFCLTSEFSTETWAKSYGC